MFQIQLLKLFNESNKNNFVLSFVSRTTDRKNVEKIVEIEADIGAAFNINSPKYLITTNQTEARAGSANKTNNVAISDYIGVWKNFVQVDGFR